MRKNSSRAGKKGALDLSINAIVVLILAITMLGLGLAFIRGLFGGSVQKLTDIFAGLNEEDKKTLMASQEPITFLQSDIKVSGREVSIPFAIRNIRGDKIGLRVKDNFFCFDAILSKTPNNPLVNRLLPSNYFQGTSAKTEQIEKDIRTMAGQQSTFALAMSRVPSPWITFGTYDERDMERNEAVVLPLTVKVAADAPATTFSCAFFPTVVRQMITREGAASTFSDVQADPQTGYEVYSKQYFNIVYTK